MPVIIQAEEFDPGAEIARMRLARPDTGAVAAFIGQVRDLNHGTQVSAMTLEHYPGMTEKVLFNVVDQAKTRWAIHDALVIHRIGELKPLDQIVLVVVTGAHRGDAFAACEFIMDTLKTTAPFWKKEITPQGARWVEARASDEQAQQRWTPHGN